MPEGRRSARTAHPRGVGESSRGGAEAAGSGAGFASGTSAGSGLVVPSASIGAGAESGD